MATGKSAEMAKHDFRYPIYRSAIGQASCLIWRAVDLSTDVPALLLNQPNVECPMSFHVLSENSRSLNRVKNLLAELRARSAAAEHHE